MRSILPLAWYYLRYHKGRTLILTVCLSTAFYLPITTQWVVSLFQQGMTARAEATPLVIGPKGSRFDLVLHALYFQTASPGHLPQAEAEAITESNLATPIPLLVRHSARGYPIVGTSLEYFELRNLEMARGHSLARLGDCVVGADIADDLQLQPGDQLLSDPENIFDIGGQYPLNMRVTGTLERTHSPDDRAVFVDLKTAWIIEGIGHGHDELDQETDPEAILRRDEDRVTASPALKQYTEITPENIDRFHFHADPAELPLTAVIADPPDPRARTLLQGRYVGNDSRYQALKPSAIIDELVTMVIQVKRFFDTHHLFVLATTTLFLFLVMWLSTRLRRHEAQTMFEIGCSRWTLFSLQAAELVILLIVSAALAVTAAWITAATAKTWIQTLTV